MDLLSLNVNPLWNLNQPVPPGIVYLGGMHQKSKKDLPKVKKKLIPILIHPNK